MGVSHSSGFVLAEDPHSGASLPRWAAWWREESHEITLGRAGSALPLPSEVFSPTSMPRGADVFSYLLVVI